MSITRRKKKTNSSTSWGHVADWYNTLIEEGVGTYQKEVILPHLLRLMEVKKQEKIVDLACGQGFFSRALCAHGVQVLGIDIAPELIEFAKKENARISKNKPDGLLRFEVGRADNARNVLSSSIDKVLIVLSIQNIANVHDVFKECARILKPKGKIYLVLNHPAFRIPKSSSWEYDAKTAVQYRRLDAYLSESKIKIQMHPGDKPSEFTFSFHRPLQYYFKALGKNGLFVNDMEEWISHKKNQPGPRAAAENRARKEFPLFLFISAQKE